MLLFLVSSGVTLIFGVLHIINFAQGSFYMLGAYFAFYAYLATGNYFVAAGVGALGAALSGIAFERSIISRVSGQNVCITSQTGKAAGRERGWKKGWTTGGA